MPRPKPVATVATDPPSGLSDGSRQLWRDVMASRPVRSPGRMALLEQALRARDRAAEAAEVIVREGLVVAGKIPHAHPAVKIEKDNRALFVQAWAKLGLGWHAGVDR